MISKAKWQTYIQKLAVIDEKAAEMIRQYIDTNGLENSQELIEYAHGIVTKYGEASAELSCEMYDLMAETQGVVVPPAEPADTATIDEVSRGVMYGKYHSPNQIPSIVGRQVRQAGADTMLKNAIRDQAEWAWIPSGDTCAFCITLASRGWQKASKKVLKGDHAEHIHANCDCTFGIAFNEKGKREYDSIYDPQKYEDMYYGADGNTPKERINSIRRARYQQNKDYINAQKRDAYQARNIWKGATQGDGFPQSIARALEQDKLIEEKGIDIVNSEEIQHNVFNKNELPNGLPINGTPNSISDKVDDSGTVIQRRIYGPDGRAEIDIDTNDHGRPDIHPTGAHKHTFDYSKKKPRSKWEYLTDQDLEDNSDIVKKGVNYNDKE